MPVKRKSSSALTYSRSKKSRSGYARRPRGSYGRKFMKKGSRFPTFKFHRYIDTLNTYNASTSLDAPSLPFTWYPSNTTAVNTYPFTFAFTASDIRNNSEFQNLFDRYMITGVQLIFQLLSNPDVDTTQSAVGAVPSVQTYPKLWYAIDHDDYSLTTLAQLKEYGNVKVRVLRPNALTKIYVPFPRTAQVVAQTSTTTPAGVNRPIWLDWGYPNVNHFGLKTCLDYGTVDPRTNTFAFRVKWEAKYYFRCKDTR